MIYATVMGNENEETELRENISYIIKQALLNADTVSGAKRIAGKLGSLGNINLTLPGVCNFDSEEEFRIALEETNKIQDGLAPLDDYDHEINHFHIGKKHGIRTKLSLIFGLDGKSMKDGYLSWNGAWCKAMTTLFRPPEINDDQWNSILLEFYEAPENMSRQDKSIFSIIKRKLS